MCGLCAKRTENKSPQLHTNKPIHHLRRRNPQHPHNLRSRTHPTHNLHAQPRYIQQRGNKPHQCLIRLAIYRRSSQRDLHRLAVNPNHTGALRSRLHVHRKGHPTRDLTHNKTTLECQRSPSRSARTSNPLQSPQQNHATYPCSTPAAPDRRGTPHASHRESPGAF